MGKQYRLAARRIASVPIVAGSFATVDLPRAYDYESIFLRIAGSVQVTAAATSVRAEAPCQLVPRVEVIADGKNTLYSAPFWFACLGSYDRRLKDANARATVPPTAVGVATYAVEATGTIDFASIDTLRPKDSAFRTSGLSLFQLRLTFGNPGDVFVGGTVNFSGTPVVEVWSREVVELPNADGTYTTPIALKKVSFQEIALPSSNANQEIRLPAGNRIKSVLARTEGSVTAGEPATNILNNLQLVNGVDIRCNVSGPNLRATNNADYGQFSSGYYVADLTTGGGPSGKLSDLWDVTQAAEPKVIVDVVGGANVKAQFVVTEMILAG